MKIKIRLFLAIFHKQQLHFISTDENELFGCERAHFMGCNCAARLFFSSRVHVLFVLLNVFARFILSRSIARPVVRSLVCMSIRCLPSSFLTFIVQVYSSWHVHFQIMEGNGINSRKNKNNDDDLQRAPLTVSAIQMFTQCRWLQVLWSTGSTSSPCELKRKNEKTKKNTLKCNHVTNETVF